jgi:hypothetical protein
MCMVMTPIEPAASHVRAARSAARSRPEIARREREIIEDRERRLFLRQLGHHLQRYRTRRRPRRQRCRPHRRRRGSRDRGGSPGSWSADPGTTSRPRIAEERALVHQRALDRHDRNRARPVEDAISGAGLLVGAAKPVAQRAHRSERRPLANAMCSTGIAPSNSTPPSTIDRRDRRGSPRPCRVDHQRRVEHARGDVWHQQDS